MLGMIPPAGLLITAVTDHSIKLRGFRTQRVTVGRGGRIKMGHVVSIPVVTEEHLITQAIVTQ
jgi:hypothetical protein